MLKLIVLFTAIAGLCRGDHAVARFNMHGVRGQVEFTFFGGSLTIESNLTGLSGTIGMFVHSLPYFPGQSNTSCAKLGKVFNPTKVSGADKALGDLTGRLPGFSSGNSVQTAKDTSGLEVVGAKGVAGRSLRLTKESATFACANIQTAGQPMMPQCGTKGMANKHQTLRATFRGKVSGTLLLRRLQGSSSSHATFYHKLYYTDDSAASTSGHHFHVHSRSIGRETWPCSESMIGPVVQHLGNSLSIGMSPSDDLATRAILKWLQVDSSGFKWPDRDRMTCQRGRTQAGARKLAMGKPPFDLSFK